MKYEIEIDDDSNDVFENNADNVLELRVYNMQRAEIKEEALVEMFLSRNALLGLGTELIRLAHRFKEGKHVHMEPADNEQQVQRMGVFLTPNSQRLIICCDEAKSIDDYLINKK